MSTIDSKVLAALANCLTCIAPNRLKTIKAYLAGQYATAGAPPIATPTGFSFTLNFAGPTTTTSWDATPAGITKTEIWTSSDGVTFVLEQTVNAPTTTTNAITAPAIGATKYAKIRWCNASGCGSFTAAQSVLNDVVTDWVTRIIANGGAAPSAANITATRTFYNTLNAAGLWSKFYILNPIVPDNAVAAKTPLIRGAGSDPWVMAGASLTVDGLLATTNSLNTGWNPTGLWTDTDACWLCYIFNNVDSSPTGQSTIGCRNTATTQYAMLQSDFANALYAWMFTNDASSLLNQPLGAAPPFNGHISGLWALSREANNFLELYRGQATFAPGTMEAMYGTANVNAKLPPNRTFFFCGENLDGVDTPDPQRRQSFCATASKLTAAELQTIYVAVTTLRQSYGGGWV